MRNRCSTGRARGALLAAGLLALGTAPGRAATPFNDPTDVQAINAIEHALATQTSMKGLIGYYAPDALVEDIMAPGLYQGRAQIRDAFDRQFVPVKSMKADIQDINIASDGTFACAALRVNVDMAMKNGTALDVSTRQLDAFKRIGGRWQIVQEQISVPMDPKTGMAVMDGRLPARGAIDWSEAMFPGPATTPARARAEIRRWVVDGSPIVDIDRMVTLYGPGNEALLYDLTTPGEYRGRGEIHDAYAPMMGTLASAAMHLGRFVADSDGQFGIQIDTQDLRITAKDGTSKIVSFRQSDCMHRVGGTWRTFFEMLSFPVDPRTGRSVARDPAASF